MLPNIFKDFDNSEVTPDNHPVGTTVEVDGIDRSNLNPELLESLQNIVNQINEQ